MLCLGGVKLWSSSGEVESDWGSGCKQFLPPREWENEEVESVEMRGRKSDESCWKVEVEKGKLYKYKQTYFIPISRWRRETRVRYVGLKVE